MTAKTGGKRLDCGLSRRKLLGPLLFLGMLFAASVGVTFASPLIVKIIAWIGVLFFGFAIFKAIGRMTSPEAVLTIDIEGIEDRRLGLGRVKWRDVKGVKVIELEKVAFLGVEVINEEELVAKASGLRLMTLKAQRAMGVPVYAIALKELDHPVEEILGAIGGCAPEVAVGPFTPPLPGG
jgi:hypothetical protein